MLYKKILLLFDNFNGKDFLTSERKVVVCYFNLLKIVCLVFISFCLLIFCIWKSTSNSCEVFSLNSYDDKYLINGLVVKKPNFNYIVINSVLTNRDVDVEVYSFQYSFYADGLLLYKAGDTSSYVHNKKNQLFSLSKLLEDINVFVNASVNSSLHLPFFKHMYLEVYYVDITLTNKLLVIPIKLNRV